MGLGSLPPGPLAGDDACPEEEVPVVPGGGLGRAGQAGRRHRRRRRPRAELPLSPARSLAAAGRGAGPGPSLLCGRHVSDG